MITARAFAGKRYAVFGLARTGLSVVRALKASGAEVYAWDDNAAARAAIHDVEFIDLNTASLLGFDALVVSPGVPLNTHPLAARARAAEVPIIGDIELFSQARAELPPHKVVGITGTNGKSTTTALIHHLITAAGRPATLGGNIGLPILGQDALPEGGTYVLELSSFQIDLTQTLDCDVAVLLNITPDHLDRYDGFAGYAASKARLFDMQSPGHVAVVSTATENSSRIGETTRRATFIAATDIADQSAWPSLQGPHNAENVAAAAAAVRALGLTDAEIEAGLRTYPGLPHRMERVAEKRGVLYVNDSKATNPTSTAPALAAFPAIHWIAGGRAKTDELDACLPHLGHVRRAYTVGEAESLFADILAPHVPVTRAGTIDNAVRLAADAAQAGEVVLLSPACASYDQFKDFEARGAAFRTAVGGLPQ
ncbi:UDP-N-acetylmuramoyl-L-alanine--D-glutamate ligase [Sphingoaurantiacus capsulatus]|uniref:UDP-N-acetylmuramoylalanine--D-glutamate ligase n=1 Tax=Sphingoaurantiacus capsulatus TaxID=1771310 RepID=A0ABV7XA80_9SPHN